LLADAGGDATGVVALGGPREGTGVFGLGGGGERLFRRGAGGKGVHGVGGIASLRDSVMPGAGVFAQGGQIHEENTGGVLLGTGVIGVGGDASNKVMPAFADTGSVGVYGQGADADVKPIVDGTGTVYDGPAGARRGRGRARRRADRAASADRGRRHRRRGRVRQAFDRRDRIDRCGGSRRHRRGRRRRGRARRARIVGQGSRRHLRVDRRAAAPADAVSREGDAAETFGGEPDGDPARIPQGEFVVAAEDRPGRRLMTLIDDTRMCTLWFCVKGWDKVNAALWTQVLLGPSFPGNRDARGDPSIAVVALLAGVRDVAAAAERGGAREGGRREPDPHRPGPAHGRVAQSARVPAVHRRRARAWSCSTCRPARATRRS
jgi:hypothetical protein